MAHPDHQCAARADPRHQHRPGHRRRRDRPQRKAELLRLFRQGVLVGLKDVPASPGAKAKQSGARLVLECQRDREADVLRFVNDLRISPTNTQAERDLRLAKTQQKISGRLRSADTTRHRYRIASYTSTAAKHGIGILQAIRDAPRPAN